MKTRPHRSHAFTLVELIVVMGLVALLAALLMPALVHARGSADQGYCANNLKQLCAANTLYAAANGSYVPAATDIFGANLQRWHGRRASLGEPFHGEQGPLAEYLEGSEKVRACPAFRRYRTSGADHAFEASCGGYGYNQEGVGSQNYVYGFSEKAAKAGMVPSGIARPSATIMFTDTAFPQPLQKPQYLIEYSFAEAYYFVDWAAPTESSYVAKPSIHFRHGGKANVVWCDGHVSSEPLETEGDRSFSQLDIGWFGGANNELFDPY